MVTYHETKGKKFIGNPANKRVHSILYVKGYYCRPCREELANMKEFKLITPSLQADMESPFTERLLLISFSEKSNLSNSLLLLSLAVTKRWIVEDDLPLAGLQHISDVT